LAEQGRQFDSGMDYNYYTTDLDEAYRQAELAEKIRQYDLGYGLDRDEFNFKLRQYEDALAAAAAAQAAAGGSGGGSQNKEAASDVKHYTFDPDNQPAAFKKDPDLIYPKVPNANPLLVTRDPETGMPITSRGLTKSAWDDMQGQMAQTYANSIQAYNQNPIAAGLVANAKSGAFRNGINNDESKLTEEQKAARARNKQLAAQRAEEKKKKQDEEDLKAALGR
jgi:hypothetical protein